MDPDAVRATSRVPHGGDRDPDVIDFSANVNPETPPGARKAYEAAFDPSRRYPADGVPEFRDAAAGYVDCDPDAVIPTPGGLAALRLAIATAIEPGETALLPAPSFGEYAREIRLQGGEPTFVAHDELLAADPDGHAIAIACHPNNPTGDAYDPDRLAAFAARCREVDTLLIVDEAFLGFTDLPSTAGDPGVVTIRSLTKLFGLPGLRAGFAVATGERRDLLETARPAWNVGTPAAAVGTHCLSENAFVAETRRRVRAERARLREILEETFAVHPSDAPFLLLDVGDRSVDDLLAAARRNGIALRDARTFRGLDSHVRVAVRLPDENDRLLEVLTNAV